VPERPTASTITDDQLDALWDCLDQVDALHREAPLYSDLGPPDPSGYCVCGESGPCTTMKIISRQRSIALESPYLPETADRED
jgi:hypothetical protein